MPTCSPGLAPCSPIPLHVDLGDHTPTNSTAVILQPPASGQAPLGRQLNQDPLCHLGLPRAQLTGPGGALCWSRLPGGPPGGRKASERG